MRIPKFEPKPLSDDEIRLAQELCAEMGECAATYHIVIQLGEIDRLKQVNKEMLEGLKSHDDYMTAQGFSGPDSKALHPKAAKNWVNVRAAIAKAVKE